MALENDYNLYYRRSFVGYKQEDGSVLPFWVDDVFTDYTQYNPHEAYRSDGGEPDDDRDHDDEFFDSEDYEPTPDSYFYCEEAFKALRFSGRVCNNGDMNGSLIHIPYDKLVLDSPKGGYFKVNTSYVYVEYRPIRQAKKGLTSERIRYRGNVSFNAVVSAMYKGNESDPNVKMGGALVLGDDVMYKGVRIGSFNQETSVLTIEVAEAGYLMRFLVAELTSCQIQVMMQQ